MTQQDQESSLPPSKRAARRILQRAFVLTGRDKQLRQHIREARLTTLWILEDWDLVWTVIIDRGKIEFERRPAKHPHLTLSWKTANEFFSGASLSSRSRSRGRGTRPPSDQSSQSEIPPRHENGRAEGTLACGGLAPPSPLGLPAGDNLRRRQAAARQGASRIFMHRGEPNDNDVFARNDSESALPESLLERAGNPELRRIASNLLKCFFGYLGHVLRNPVDGAGESLL